MPRLEVELLVCPEPSCRHVGKLPHVHGLKGYCIGSLEKRTGHKKARMVLVTFKGQAPKPVETGAKV